MASLYKEWSTTRRILPRRIGAWLVDVALVCAVGKAAGWPGWVAGWFYWILRDGCFEGQSLGKRLLRLKVVSLPSQQPCTFTQSIRRNLLWVLPVTDVVMSANSTYAVLTGKSGHHWGDRLASTQVIHV